MTTFSSKQEKKQGLADPILILVSITLIGVLVVFGPLSGGMSSIRNVLTARGDAGGNISISGGAYFAPDLQYWDANCSHGWTSDSTCDTLVSITQACAVGTGSAYCSEYDTYLQRFRGQ